MSDLEHIDANASKLRDRQADLVLMIEAIDEVLKTKAWQTLKELVWDSEVQRIERLLLGEAKSDEPKLKELYTLQGQLSRAKQYGDLKSYAEMWTKELKAIKENQK